jgi:hypothetical protein
VQGVERNSDRERLKLLDGCLQELEDAHEADLRTVPDRVAARVRAHVPAVLPGMPIPDAINLVLNEQEPYMNGAGAALIVRLHHDNEHPLDEVGARDLTEKIKGATRQVCMLLFEAHRRRAWQALGYTSWDQYVLSEFGLSRTRSYELLDQGRVIGAIMAAADISGIPDISAYAAGQIKPFLPEVIDSVRRETTGLPETQAMVTISRLVSERRTMIALERQRAEQPAREAEAADGGLRRLHEALERLVAMPPVGDVIAGVDGRRGSLLVQIEQAQAWLAELTMELRRREPALAGRLGLPAFEPVRDQESRGGSAR